jgi:hypothetical protein
MLPQSQIQLPNNKLTQLGEAFLKSSLSCFHNTVFIRTIPASLVRRKKFAVAETIPKCGVVNRFKFRISKAPFHPLSQLFPKRSLPEKELPNHFLPKSLWTIFQRVVFSCSWNLSSTFLKFSQKSPCGDQKSVKGIHGLSVRERRGRVEGSIFRPHKRPNQPNSPSLTLELTVHLPLVSPPTPRKLSGLEKNKVLDPVHSPVRSSVASKIENLAVMARAPSFCERIGAGPNSHLARKRVVSNQATTVANSV